MELGRLIGTVVATVKAEGLDGVKLQLLQPLDSELQERGETLVVANTLSAGAGEIVAWVGGREAALALPNTFVPIDAAVVEVIDSVDHDPGARVLPMPGLGERE